jgi:hypothetical protein
MVNLSVANSSAEMTPETRGEMTQDAAIWETLPGF